MKNSEKKAILFITFIMAVGLSGSYGFMNMKDAYYNVIKTALGINDVQLSAIWTVYGIVAVCSYIPGGMLADRFPPDKLMSASLIGSTLLHLWMSVTQSYHSLLIISALFGVCSILIYFPASSKILTGLGKKENAGGTVGKYYAMGGIMGVVGSCLSALMFAIFKDERSLFVFQMRYYALLCLLSAAAIIPVFRNIKVQDAGDEKFEIKLVGEVIRHRQVWLISFAMLCTYVLFCTSAYMTPLLTERYDIPEGYVLYIGLIRGTVSYVAGSYLFGWLAQKKKSALSVEGRAFFLMAAVTVSLIGVTKGLTGAYVAIAITFLFTFMAAGIKNIGLAMVREVGFSYAVVGTVIGIATCIGYSPDAYIYQIAGFLIQKFGISGYSAFFLIGAVVSILGGITVTALERSLNH